MKTFLENKWVIGALRLAVGGVFLYAGFLKMQDPQAFADSIATFKLLPDSLINLLALGLPPFEMLAGALLLMAGWLARASALGIIIMTVIFALALGQGLFRGLEINCGCFGDGLPSLWKTWMSLGRDFLLLGAALWLYRAFSADKSKSTY